MSSPAAGGAADDVAETWLYLDPSGQQHGPFTAYKMKRWLNAAYFTADLEIKVVGDPTYKRLGSVFPDPKNAFNEMPDKAAPAASALAAATTATSGADAARGRAGEIETETWPPWSPWSLRLPSPCCRAAMVSAARTALPHHAKPLSIVNTVCCLSLTVLTLYPITSHVPLNHCKL